MAVGRRVVAAIEAARDAVLVAVGTRAVAGEAEAAIKPICCSFVFLLSAVWALDGIG